jgi:hypothetical protein
MTARVLDLAQFIAARGLLVLIVFVTLTAIKLAAMAGGAPPSHPERVVISIR